MAPVQTTLKMRTGERKRYQMDLRYTGRHVSSEVATAASADGKQPAAKRAVAADIPEATVDQPIDWATVMSADFGLGKEVFFNVYDASTGTSRVTCTIRDAGTLSTPLGAFHAIRLDYTVYKASGTESYTVFANSSAPLMMLREDLPGGLTSELIKVEE
jgi:hypothetical protein